MVWTVLLLLGIYTFLLAGLAYVFRALGVPARWAVWLAFLVYGVFSGLLAAWLWPYDSCVYPNFPAVLLADQTYHLSAERLGDPWALRPPQVYALASAVLCAVLGGAAQTIFNRATARRTGG